MHLSKLYYVLKQVLITGNLNSFFNVKSDDINKILVTKPLIFNELEYIVRTKFRGSHIFLNDFSETTEFFFKVKATQIPVAKAINSSNENTAPH